MDKDFNITISVGTYEDMSLDEVQRLFYNFCSHSDLIESFDVLVKPEEKL